MYGLNRLGEVHQERDSESIYYATLLMENLFCSDKGCRVIVLSGLEFSDLKGNGSMFLTRAYKNPGSGVPVGWLNWAGDQKWASVVVETEESVLDHYYAENPKVCRHTCSVCPAATKRFRAVPDLDTRPCLSDELDGNDFFVRKLILNEDWEEVDRAVLVHVGSRSFSCCGFVACLTLTLLKNCAKSI